MHFDHISNSGAAINQPGDNLYFWQHSKKNWRINSSVSHYCQVELLNLRLRHAGDMQNIVSPAQFSITFHWERQTKLLTNLSRGARPVDGALSAVVCICSLPQVSNLHTPLCLLVLFCKCTYSQQTREEDGWAEAQNEALNPKAQEALDQTGQLHQQKLTFSFLSEMGM